MEELERFKKDYPWQSMKCLNRDFKYRISVKADCDTAIVLFTGGIGFSDLVYEHFIEFSKYYTVITFDYWKEYETICEFSDAVASLLGSLGLKAWFLGQSLGGILSQIVAAAHPEVCKGLVLSNTCSLSNDNNENAKNRIYEILMKQKKMKRVVSLLPFPIYKKMVLSTLRKDYVESMPEHAKQVVIEFKYVLTTELTKEHASHMFSFLFDLKNHIGMMKDDFKYLEGRVYILLASDDHTYNNDLIEALKDLMPSPLVENNMEGGHLAMIMNTEEYVKRVRAFIDAH